MLDVIIDSSKVSLDKIIINSKSINTQNQFTVIKLFQSFSDVIRLEVCSINLIKIHKTIYLNLPYLVHIDLHDNKLIKISKNFKLFKNLITLKLDNNLITFIPSFIGDFSKLECLSICNNNLTAIPASIQYLSSLKTFKFSNNKIAKLPIEFGQLKSLECLYLDSNYYTDIPTTLCYLRHLNEISFEWFEFIDPPYYKILKESVGKTCIGIVRSTLQEMIKKSELYCDFNTFVEKLSSNKSNNNNNNSNTLNNSNSNNQTLNNKFKDSNNLNNLNNINKTSIGKMPLKNSIVTNSQNNTIPSNKQPNVLNILNNKYLKIFTAIENNYYGVVKALLDSTNNEYLTIKNVEHKTPFYIAIHNRNDDMINLFISKINLSKYPLTYLYFHKAIRMRNPELVKQIVKMGVNINSVDDQGNGCFHVLFSAFTKQLSKCTLIADFLLENGAFVNSFNNDNWAPIHIASRRSCKECLLWILTANKKLASEGKEQFDLNLKGKNKWTPLHLTINSYKLEETLILLENGCNVFARENNAKTPKRVSNGNYLFTKLLTNYENIIYRKKYENEGGDKMNHCIRCFTTVDGEEENLLEENYNKNKNLINDINNIKDNSNIIIKEEIVKNDDDENNEDNTQQNILHKSKTDAKFKPFNLKNIINENIVKNKKNSNDVIKIKDTDNINNINNINNNINPKNEIDDYNDYDMDLDENIVINPNKIISNPSNINIEKSSALIKDRSCACLEKNININNIMSPFSKNLKNQPQGKYGNFKNLNNVKNNLDQGYIINNNNNLKINNDSDLSDTTKEIPYQTLYNIENLKDNLLNPDTSLFEKYTLLRKLKLGKQNLFLVAKMIIENVDIDNNSNLIILTDICNYISNNGLVDLIPILEILKNTIQNNKKNFRYYIIHEIKNTIQILKIFKKNSFYEKEFFKIKEKESENKYNNLNKKNNNDDNNEMFLKQNKNEDDEEEDFNFDEMNELLGENIDEFSNTQKNLNIPNPKDNQYLQNDNSKLKLVANSMEIPLLSPNFNEGYNNNNNGEHK